ncbi:hypothetical protein C0995_000191 [Termitomyces sp. Mi166|nr:hypothetical protein C0995_000191 [Termitomyces sp. Mi166\
MSTASAIEPALKANQLAAQHGVDLSKLPNIMNMSADSITSNVHAINSNCTDERTKFIFKSLISHLHAFIRETSITNDEWMSAIQFLTQTGQMCSDVRQEFILLSDVLGVSTLVDTINNAKPPTATEATVLGPFFTEDAEHLANGETIASEGKGDYMFVEGRVLDTKGNPIPGAIIDTWESDHDGLYDVQAPGFEKLITALYFEGDPYLSSDAVFGVRTSLIMKLETVTDEDKTIARGFKQKKPHAYLKKDFVLATPEEGAQARKGVSKHVQ